jgi:hypothetical protein
MDIQELRSEFPSHDGALCEVDRLRGIIKRNKCAFKKLNDAYAKEVTRRRSAEHGRDQLAMQLGEAKRAADADATSNPFGGHGDLFRGLFGGKK